MIVINSVGVQYGTLPQFEEAALKSKRPRLLFVPPNIY